MESERDVEEKVAARAFAKEYLTDLHSIVLEILLAGVARPSCEGSRGCLYAMAHGYRRGQP